MDKSATPDGMTGRHVRIAAGTCAIAAGALAVFVLMTWLTGNWRLGMLGADYVVMAPSTACLMILLSVAAFFRRLPRNRDSGRFVAWMAVACVAMTALASWSRQLLGFQYPGVGERIASAVTGALGVPLSPLSPLTMTVLILTALAFLLDLSPPRTRRFWRHLGPAASAAGLAAALVVVLDYAMGAPALRGAPTEQIALPAALCLALLNAAMFLDSSSDLWPISVLREDSGFPSAKVLRFAPVLSALFVLLVISMGTVGGLYLRRQQAEMRRAAQATLEAVASAQVGIIRQWLAERMNDARFFMEAPFDTDDLQELLSNSDSGDERAKIIQWLSIFQAGGRYRRITVYNPSMNPLAGTNLDTSQPEAGLRDALSTAFRENRAVIADTGLAEDGDRHVDILAPLCAKKGEAPDGPVRPQAVLVLCADARSFISSPVPAWPMGGPSVETLLVRRGSGDMLPLARRNAEDGAARSGSIPVAPSDVAGTMAARGEAGIAEGRDHRGVPSLSAVLSVPEAPWSIVARMDESAIYAVSMRQTWQAAAIILLLVMTAALCVAMLWRQRNLAFRRESLDLEREHSALARRFDLLMKNAHDIILLAADDGSILETNDRAIEAYGYSQTALRRMKLSDLRTPSSQADGERRTDELRSVGSNLYESVHCRADGSTFPVEISGSTVDIGGETCMLFMVRDISERQRAAEALQISEQNFRALFDSVPDFLFVVGRGGVMLRVNEAVVARLGYSKKDLKGRNMLFLHPEDRREDAADMLEMMLAGKTDHCSVPLVARNGTVIPVETRMTPGLWSGREVLFIVSRDISALRASEEKFAKAFQDNPALIAISSIEDGRYLEVNETFLNVTGYTREEVIGATSLGLGLFVNPEQRAVMKAVLLEKGVLNNYEIAVRTKDGQVRNGLFSGHLIQMQDKKVLLTVMNDVTELKRAQEALVRIGKAVDSTGDAIGMADPNGVHFYQNRAYTELVGYAVEELASPLGPVMVYEDREAAREMFLTVMRGESWSGELVVKAKNGSKFSAAVQADAIRDEQGKIIGLIGVHRDISQRKRQEEELQRLLEQTQRDARVKAELLAEVNHRVKNNLTSILGLLLGEKQHARDECRAEITAVLDSLALRIRGLLQVHQMLSDAHWQPLRLNDLAVRVIRAALMAIPRGRDISVTVRPSSAQLSPRQAGSMAMVLNELAVNTAKHALQDRRELNIMVTVVQEDGLLCLEYRDDGPGYPQTVLEGGGGVGMHLVRQLVCESLRGTLNLHNENGAVAVLCLKTEDMRQT